MFQFSLVLLSACGVSVAHIPDQCGWGGKAPIGPRIIKGSLVYKKEFPFAIYLTQSGSLYCGGTIITDRYVLTAGHCVYGLSLDQVQIVAGVTDVYEGSNKHYEVEKAIMHENYHRHEAYDDADIALLKTFKEILFSNSITPICLPSKTDYTDKSMVILGWGITEKQEKSPFLLKSSVKLIDSEICLKEEYTKDMKKTENICAYALGTDTCQGDSGGGLIYETEPYRYEIVGIVSWGYGCATEGVPGVYMNVSHYIPWIREKAADSNFLP